MGKTLAKPKGLEVRKGAGFAIASLVLGIFSVILGWIPVFGWIFVVLALVFAILALLKIKKGEASGRGMAIAGLVLGGIGLVIAVIVMITFITSVGSSSKCTDMDCFISNANQCKPTMYVVTTEMGEIAYFIETDKTGNCILTKEIVELSKNEDPALKKVLEGKKMECTYSSGKFNGQWTSSMIEGLEDCHGELKDAIGQLLLLV